MWQIVADCGRLWQIIADCGRLLQIVADYDGLWQTVADCGRLWQIVASCGIFCLQNMAFCVILGHYCKIVKFLLSM